MRGKTSISQQPERSSHSVYRPNPVPFFQVRGESIVANSRHPFFTPLLQPKLTVNAPDDIYEKEADAVADKVMKMPDPHIQRQEEEEEEMLQMKEQRPGTRRKWETCEAEESLRKKSIKEEVKLLQTKRDLSETSDIGLDLESSINTQKGGGQPLSQSSQDFFKSRIGADFSGVRIHTGTESDILNQSLNAKAFTTGQDIFFRKRKYNPGSLSGKKLLAHELTHVVQQNGGRIERKELDKKSGSECTCHLSSPIQRKVQLKLKIGKSDNIYEKQADNVSERRIRMTDHSMTQKIVPYRQNNFPLVQWVDSECKERLQCQLIPYSYSPTEIRESDVTNDPNGLSSARLEDLFILYGAGWRLHRLPPSGAVYSREWVLDQAGTALIRGYIRSKLNTKLDHPNLQEWFLTRVDRMRGANDRKNELRDMIHEAFERGEELGQSLAEETSPTLADVGHQGRTFSRRGTSRDGTRDLSHRIHAGMDVPGPRGTGIYTPLDGRVIFAGQISGYGNIVRILHENPPPTEIAGEGSVTTNYAHLDSLLVTEGDTVNAGQAVGLMGNTRRGSRGGVGGVTRAMGVHLHFSVQRVPPSGPGRLSSRYEERHDIRIRPDTWLRQLGVQITEIDDRATEEATSQNVQREINIQRYPNSNNNDPLHQPIIENYRRWRRLPPGGVDELGQQVGPSDAEIKYGGLRESPLTQTEVEQRLSAELIRYGDGSGTDLSSEYIRAQLEVKRHNPDLLVAFNDAAQQAGQESFELQMTTIERVTPSIVTVLESQRRRLSDEEYEHLRDLSESQRRNRIRQLQSPQTAVSGTGGWLQYNEENLIEFRNVFEPLLTPLGLTVNNLLVLSSMMSQENPTYQELPPRDLWPNMQQTLEFLAHLSNSSGVTFQILSAYRSDVVNALSGGASTSTHMDFSGLDVHPSDGARFEAFIKYYWHLRGAAHRFGLGFYHPSRVHIDTKRYRRWRWDEGVSASQTRYQSVFGNTPLPN